MSSEKFLPLPQEEESAAYAPMMDAAATSLPEIPGVTATLGGSAVGGGESSGGGGLLSRLFPPSPGRQNHLFLRCCCDCRRATLVVNCFTIVWNLIIMILMFVGVEFLEKNASAIAQDMDDDQVAKEFEEMAKNGTLDFMEGIMDVIFMFSIVLHGFGVYGAIHYQNWAIIVSAVGYGIALFFALIGLDFANIIIKGLFLYPHLVLIKEINEGIMTDYNYANVKSCCDAC